jgi:eukaryotic-like serine/threonine-protein kinase
MAVDAARAKSLFLAASDLADPAERAAYLDRECGGDAELRDRVEALLRANDAAPLPPAGAGDGTSAHVPDRLPEMEDYGDPTARVGSVLAGKYKLIEEIGTGGMGSVYMAQQTEPVKRAVAVKVIKAGMDSKAVLVRFEAERQALAMMDHPNIAKVLDADTTDGSRPFFVMELVKGQPITKFCDERKLTPRQRLELFVPVCQAIQHAHQKGVIHRDIKPSNVLVTMYDDRPVPKVIDFGVAKAAGQSLTDRTLMTGFGAVVGTPEYMSPEQANLDNQDIDTRSDVYSLGVLLYELLTGTTPVDRKSLGKAALLEILRIVREVEAPPPSAKLSTIDTLPSVAANRGTEPAKLSKLMKGELDWVLLKALEKDRARRYETANALSRDLQRYLADEVVEARPPSTGYRLKKFVRRHKGQVIAASLVLLALVGGIVGTSFGLYRENQARWAEAAREDEKNQRNRAEALRHGAETARDEADQARAASEKSRAAAEAATYRALLSEVRALRAAHEPGWRDKALADLARLAIMPTPRRDLPELRTEAAATLAAADIRLVAKVELPSDATGSLTFSPNGRTLLTTGPKGGLDFWDLPGNRHLSSVEGLTASQSASDRAVYLPDGQGLAVGTRDHGVVFTDAQGIRTTRAPITQVPGQPTRLAISGNGQWIAVAWTDGAGITVHDVASGTLVERFKDSTAPFALSPDGRWLARAENADIVLLPIASGEPRIVLGRHGGATALDFRPDVGMLAASFRDHTTGLWDVAKREQVGTLRGHREQVLDVAFSPDGEWIATGGLDYTTRIWETRTGQNVATLPGGSSPAFRVRWSPTGDHLAVSMNNTRQVFLYKITGRHGVQQWLTGHRVELRCLAAHPRLERLTTSGYTELMSWDLSVPRPSPVAMEPNSGAVTSLAYSPDGSLLATASWRGSDPGEVLVRDASTGKVRGRTSVPQVVQALVFDPTVERLACGDMAGNVVLWDLATSRPVQQFATGSTIRSIVFLDRPRILVTHGKDAVFFFNLETGTERKVDLAGGGIRKLVADRQRSRLVVGFENGALGSLSLPDLTPGPRLENAHEGAVAYLALSPDGRLLATGSDHRVVLRDAMSFETLLVLPLWAGELRDLTFDSRSRHLAIVGTDTDIDLWNLAALYDGLTAVGLAWDRPAPAVVPASDVAPEGEHLRPAVPFIRRPG